MDGALLALARDGLCKGGRAEKALWGNVDWTNNVRSTYATFYFSVRHSVTRLVHVSCESLVEHAWWSRGSLATD